MREYLSAIGLFLILSGFALVIISSLINAETKTKFAFGGFIGPFPFGFANSPIMLWIIIGLTAVIVLLNFIMRIPK